MRYCKWCELEVTLNGSVWESNVSDTPEVCMAHYEELIKEGKDWDVESPHEPYDNVTGG